MAREKPNSSPSKRIRARDSQNPLGYFQVPNPNSVRAARPPKIKALTCPVQAPSIQPSNFPSPKNDMTLVSPNDDTDMLNYPEASNPATTPIAALQRPTSSTRNRKRAFADNVKPPTASAASEDAKRNTNRSGNATVGGKRRKVSKPGFGIFKDDAPMIHEAAKGSIQGAEAKTTSSSTKVEIQQPCTGAKKAKAKAAVSRGRWTRTVGKRVRIKKRELLQVQVKPVIRLLARPRFTRKANDNDPKDHVIAAVVSETKLFTKIMESGLPGLKKTEGLFETFYFDPDIDTQIAKGLKASGDATGLNEDSEESVDDEDDDVGAVKAARATNKLNNLVIHNGLDRSLPPIHSLPAIFEDMVLTGLDESKSLKVQDFVNHVQGRALRVGTMCSGTECPILALGLVNDALKRLGKPTIPFTHVLSCEIVPYKQAYIQRNFDPQYLFRDVTELPGQEASTAYGSAVEVPRDLDILIAGSSCTDYSGLNNYQKEYGEEGQSMSTFQGVLGYAKRHKPRIVLLENVYKAPWKDLRTEFENVGYTTFVSKVDTKDFYIPQTRMRGYMIGFNREFATTAGLDLANIATDWANFFEAYSRRASSPFTDFIYSEEDPWLDQIRRELIISQSLEKARRKVDWLHCRHRYISFRAAYGLGFRKPVTMWENNGTCKFPDGSWLKWAKGQVERIWDTIDINHLRCVAQRDYDNRWKIRVVELSQNIDRDQETRAWGIIGCITPSGIPYLTTRGGPITGPELLALQAIPTDKLSLTYESSRQLQDFAGNAMTSTVVCAALLAAFGVGFKILRPGPGASDIPSVRLDIPFSELIDDGTGQPRTDRDLPVGPIDLTDFKEIQNLAGKTMQLCSCEGRFGCSHGPLQHCLSCGHTTCTTCGQNPLHKYELIPQFVLRQRQNPSDFEKQISNWLPLQLRFEHFDIPVFTYSTNAKVKATQKKVKKAIEAAFEHPVHLASFSRTRSWKATYESSYARLDIVFSRKMTNLLPSSLELNGFLGAISVKCYLYAKPEANESVDSLVRADLTQPIARMTCNRSLYESGWEIRIPKPAGFTLEIKYLGRQIDSWEANLGLKDKNFMDRQVTQRVGLTCSAGHEICPVEILGVYELLPDCDAACGSLHRKLGDAGSRVGPSQDPIFFFLDPGTLCNGALDSFVFANTHHRLPLGGTRDVLAQVEKGWRPASSASDLLPCTVPGHWQKCRRTHLEVPEQDGVNIRTSMPGSIASMKVDISRCTHVYFTALVCSFPLRGDQHAQWTEGNVYSIDLIDKPDAFRPFTQLIQRAGGECGFENWMEIALPSTYLALCRTCAPAKPRLVFPTIKSKSLVKHVKERSEKPLLVEDQHQAFEFEKKIRSRPSPVLTDLHCHKDGNGVLKLQLNVATLVHRAHAKIAGQASKCVPLSRIQWRLVRDSGFEQLLPFPELSPPSNKDGLLADYPPNWVKEEKEEGLLLTTPQRQSLSWMLEQESSEGECWVEVEIEEARIPSANLRLEAKVECIRRIRGGILADEVGYGKTATILALFDSDASDYDGTRRLPTTAFATADGKINVKATLVLAPADLLTQWHGEFYKFLRKDPSDEYVVLTIESEKHLKALTIRQICEADLILSTWEVFGDWYLEELAYFGHSPQLPKRPGRAFQQWLSRALKNLGTVVVGSEACDYEDYRPTWRTLDAEKPSSQGFDLTCTASDKTVCGEYEEETKKTLDDNFKAVDMKERAHPKIAPLLHLFSFRRVVTDEFTYVQGKQLSALLELVASRKWVLSGTPPLGNFRDINNMAMLLGTKLSTDDNDGGVFESQSALKEKMKDKTLAEEFLFYSYQTRRSPSWYEARYKLCRKFVQQFIRKNPADLRDVELHRHYELLDLTAAERATYFELFQMLMSQPLKFSAKEKPETAAKSDHAGGRDRTKRLQEMATASKSPEEALLISCSTSMSNINGVEAHDRSASRVCRAIIAEKKKHFRTTVQELYKKLTEIFELWELGYSDIASENPHFYSFLRSVDNNQFGDLVAKAVLDCVMGHARAGARKTAVNSKVIPPGPRRLAVIVKALWNSLSKSDQKRLKANSSTPVAASKVTQHKPAEDQTEGGSSVQRSATAKKSDTKKGEAKKRQPDLRELGPRTTFMYGSAAVLTNLSLRLIEHLRGLRFFHVVELYVNGGQMPSCSHCGSKRDEANEILIMGLCGHASCIPCFEEKQAQRKLVDECVADGCEAPAPRHSAFLLSELNVATSHLPRPFGSKIEAVLKLLQDTNRVGTNDHVVIFVQFKRLKAALIEGLKDANITHVDGFHKHAVEKFKNGAATVCILDPESVDAAGWNLQIANHVIFLSSLVIDTQYKYESIYEQAVGRVHRRGQKKDVHVYYFLAARTMDVNILEDREGKTLVQRDGKYLLLAESEIEEGDKRDLAGALFEGAACSMEN